LNVKDGGELHYTGLAFVGDDEYVGLCLAEVLYQGYRDTKSSPLLKGESMNRYVVIDFSLINNTVKFDVIETELKRSDRKFWELIEEWYEDNYNTVLVVDFNDDFLNELRKLQQKVNDIVLKMPLVKG
jgi:hypothetical protein